MNNCITVDMINLIMRNDMIDLMSLIDLEKKLL